jgi:hypothetical protein
VGRPPLFGDDVVTFQAKKRAEDVLHIVLVLYFESVTVLPSSQMPGYRVEAGTDLSEEA